MNAPTDIARVLAQAGSTWPAAEHIDRAASAHDAIARLMEAGSPLAVAFSSGKDSSVVANLVLTTAALRMKAGQHVPPILVMHSDTGVENPEVRRLADSELQKMRSYAAANQLPLTVRVGKPLLYSSWAVRVLSGRALPSFAGSNRDCAVEFKVKPSRRLTAQAMSDLAEASQQPRIQEQMQFLSQACDQLELDFDGLADSNAAYAQSAAGGDSTHAEREERPIPVVMTGVRLNESAHRNAAIKLRGESDNAVWTDEAGRHYMSPILQWSADEVFEYLGYANAGMIESYSSFDETLQFYRDAGGSSCAVVGAMALDEEASKQAGGCGARSGCWTCVAVSKDASLQNMIEGDPQRYGYMRGLGELRNFIAQSQYDWSRRNFVGRTIGDDGCIAVMADTYSPAMLEELLHYALSIQAAEISDAARERRPVRFSVVSMQELVAIDAIWSLYGLHRPFHAIEILRRVEEGDWRFPPQLPSIVRTPTPRLGRLFVGHDWDDELLTGDPRRDAMRSTGIRNHMLEMFQDTCGRPARALKDGSMMTAYATSDSFEVDEEGVELLLGTDMLFEQLAQHHDNPRSSATTAVRWYLQMGTITPAHGSLERWQRIAKRTDWLERLGLGGQVDLRTLKELVQSQPFRSSGDEDANSESDSVSGGESTMLRQRVR